MRIITYLMITTAILAFSCTSNNLKEEDFAVPQENGKLLKGKDPFDSASQGPLRSGAGIPPIPNNLKRTD